MHCKSHTAMDAFLGQNGYCRKMLVRDGTCIYRAVSEKMFLTQAYHTHVGQRCAEYIQHQQKEELQANTVHRDLSGILKMMVLSKIYQLEFYVFHQPGLPPFNVTNSGQTSEVCLVSADSEHYDLVYTRNFVQSLAITQSVVYEILYRGVFGLSVELEQAVCFIRHQKKHQPSDENEEKTLATMGMEPLPDRVVGQRGPFCLGQVAAAGERPFPPLPYRIAKALDPTIYRNVELDIVQEEKREIKLRYQGRGLYGVFCPGDKCQVQLVEDQPILYNAHVQEINEPRGPVVVFIEELGEKKSVAYSCLRPLPLSLTNQGCESQSLPVAHLGPLPFADKRGRRRKSSMPGAGEFQSCSGRGARPSTRRAPESQQNTLTSQPITVDCLGLADSMEAAGAGYCVVASSIPMAASQPPLGAIASSPGAGHGAGGGVVYWMPVVTVPYASNMGQVNLACAPSQDPYGKDLPLSDVNTLRYFFNLGVEYFRISANMQQQQQQTLPPPQAAQHNYLPQLMASGPHNSSIMMTLEQGASFTAPEPPPLSFRPRGGQHCTALGKNPVPPTGTKPSSRGGGGGPEGNRASESMEMSSDLSDSGCCTSCGEGGQTGQEDLDAQMELVSGRTDEDSGSTQGEEGGSEKGGKAKGKRKYYMYGPHKLIKPIKDIPPRFQLLLAENSAAKARCEGQPIYMQLTHAELLALEQGDACSGLNAEAQCFYPATQHYDSVMVDDTGMATFSSSSTANPPLMVPPPVGQSAALSVVYSSVPTSSVPLPPPAYSHATGAGPPSLRHTGDGKTLSVASSSGSPGHAGKGQAHCSGPEKRPEEFARPSSGFPTLPATPPQGPTHGGGMTQGQVVYLMNPQSFGPAPPCTAYQPSLMAAPPHGMGLPCPPVAVQ